MKQRLQFLNMVPELMNAVYAMSKAVNDCGLESGLMHLVKLRASQINGCSYCVDMHNKEALQDGEGLQRLFLVAAWKESPLFSERERAAFAYTEAVTHITEGVSDELYQATLEHFSEDEIVKLTVAIGMINVWNRLCVSFHAKHPVERAKAA